MTSSLSKNSRRVRRRKIPLQKFYTPISYVGIESMIEINRFLIFSMYPVLPRVRRYIRIHVDDFNIFPERICEQIIVVIHRDLFGITGRKISVDFHDFKNYLKTQAWNFVIGELTLHQTY